MKLTKDHDREVEKFQLKRALSPSNQKRFASDENDVDKVIDSVRVI
jgi:hypothetical protein